LHHTPTLRSTNRVVSPIEDEGDASDASDHTSSVEVWVVQV
jgi:hypothetical protein